MEKSARRIFEEKIPEIATKQPILSEGAFTDGDKTKLDNITGINTGDETTLSIQTKRPLKTVSGQSLEGVGSIEIGGSGLNGSCVFVSTLQAIGNGSSVDWTGSTNIELGTHNVSVSGTNIVIAGQTDYFYKIVGEMMSPDETDDPTLTTTFGFNAISGGAITISDGEIPSSSTAGGLAGIIKTVAFYNGNNGSTTIRLVKDVSGGTTPKYVASIKVTKFQK